MKKIILLAVFVLAGCGYQGSYRYECQDPDNWDSKSCNPPDCLVDGMCTETLLGFDPTPDDGVSVPTTEPLLPTVETTIP